MFGLKKADYGNRCNFSLRVLAHTQIKQKWLCRILWADETHFTLNGGQI